MKEKNFKRKQRLKKEREKILLKQKLHHDLALFMTDIEAATCNDSFNLLNKLLFCGFKGYDRMRGKDLVKLFDKYYARLRNVKEPMPMIHSVNRGNDDDYDYNQKGIPGVWRRINHNDVKNKEALRSELIFESDALMNRLMEIAFDLDFHE